MAIKPVSRLVELNKTVTVQVSPYQGVVYAALRYMYEDPKTGDLLFGKNGVNIPIEYLPKALAELAAVYNEATGSTLEIVGDNTILDPDLEI
jgi:hypothetical protein